MQVGGTVSDRMEQNVASIIMSLIFVVSLLPADTGVSKVVIPRLQLAEQSSHTSPNKSTKVSWNQQAPHVISFPCKSYSKCI